MAITNHERVGKALELLREGLRPFVEGQLKAKGDAMQDVAVQLVIMDRSWGDVFRKVLGRAERSLVNELLVARNRWAHQDSFSVDDADRALDSVSRLLTAISAPQADNVGRMKMELRRLVFDEQRDAGVAVGAGGTRVKAMPTPTSEDQVMTQADRIRRFVFDRYIAPARTVGRAEIVIRAGDVHRAMGLANAMPAVCSAIGGNKFEELAGVTAVKRSSPANGANVYFYFSLAPRSRATQTAVPWREPTPMPSRMENDLDLANAIVLVSCVKSKLPHPAPARSLYTST